jgi:hypothetical protein
MIKELNTYMRQEFELAAKAAGFRCVEYASDSYEGPAIKCLIEQVERLKQEIPLALRYDQWDERFVMVYPAERQAKA